MEERDNKNNQGTWGYCQGPEGQVMTAEQGMALDISGAVFPGVCPLRRLPRLTAGLHLLPQPFPGQGR